MPKKKAEEKEPEEEQVEEVKAEVQPEAPAPLPDAVDVRVAQIVSLFSEIGQVEGVPFNKDNPKHRLIAAWMIGRGAWLRK